jgi:hypothetical protein
MALDLERIPFGLSNITITDANDEVVKFDGVEELQAEGGEVTISPELEDIVIADYGNTAYDQRVVGYTGTVTINAAQESIAVLQMALAASEAIVDSTSSDVVGVTDSAIGSSLRAKGKTVHIHPRNLPAELKDMDITIYKMVSNGEFTRTTGNTQSNITITLSMLPRDGMDPSKPGNFFYIGGQDPNEDAA